MREFCIEGGNPLSGETKIQGSKNAALPIMAAALLHNGITILHNCPWITDVFSMEEILKSLGVKTKWEGHTLLLDCREVNQYVVQENLVATMRSSIILLSCILSRKGTVEIGYPGGCCIGKRPVDLHLQVLTALGATLWEENSRIHGFLKEPYKGTHICFPFSSVGATEQAVLGAVMAEGVTVLENCAKEPEIVHLCEFLQRMGGEIHGIGTNHLWIRGGKRLHDVEYCIPSDRIVAGTYVLAAAATRGKIVLGKAPVEEMKSLLDVYQKMGGQWEYNSGKLIIDATGLHNGCEKVETAVYPGFPTDLQSVLISVLLTVEGESIVKETIFENRFQVVKELEKMGGQITIVDNYAYITGGNPLRGACVQVRELRGGAALVVAGLAAKGETVVQDTGYIVRGYEQLDEDLLKLGARIKKNRRVYEISTDKGSFERK